jgi:hypothetical protein
MEVTDIDESDTILSGGVDSFKKLDDPPPGGGDCGLTTATPCPGQPAPPLGALDGGVCSHQLGNLAAQTLALTYSTLFFPNPTTPTFGAQTLSQLGDCITGHGIDLTEPLDLGSPVLTPSSSFFAVLYRANLIINDAAFVEVGPDDAISVTPRIVVNMTKLLGHCVNQVDAVVSAYPSGRGDFSPLPGSASGEGGFPFLALLGGVGGAIAIAAVITPGIKARRWRRPDWW